MLLTNIKDNPRLSFFSAFFFIVFICLSVWQISKGFEKYDLETDFEQSLALFPEQYSYDSKQWDLISINGRFDFDKEILIDNKIYSGQKGYTVLTPFIPTDLSLHTFLVDRGWTSNSYSSTPLNESNKTIKGIIYSPEKNFVVGDDLASDDWPKVVQQKDISFLESVFPNKLEKYLIKLDPANPYTLEYVPLIPSKISSSKHFGYAFQWLIMAIVLAFVFFKFINKHYEQ